MDAIPESDPHLHHLDGRELYGGSDSADPTFGADRPLSARRGLAS